MLKYLLFLLPAVALAENCVLTDRTVTQGQVSITERSGIRQELVTLPDQQRRCQVTFRARIGDQWHTAFGHYDWPGDRPAQEACGIAVQRADSAVIERVGRTMATTEKIMICRDSPDLTTVPSARVGITALLHQFRPHPNYPNAFWHNGTQCRWFLDSQFRRQDIYTYQGIICQIQPNRWVVVDKF